MIKISIPVCYIVGASKETCDDVLIIKNEKDVIIAADGGYDILNKNNITPDIVIGDFDSVSKLPTHENLIEFPPEKDYTDMFLAYKEGEAKGFNNFVIYGGTGGRIDHTISNIQLLADIAINGGRAFLLGEGAVLTAIHNEKIEFSSDYTGKISVFSIETTSKSVTIRGLKYSTDNILLNCNTPLGVSNEFVGERAEISVKDGTLLIIWYETPQNFIKNINNLLK